MTLKLALVSSLLPALLSAQPDPASAAISQWQRDHGSRSDASNAASLFDASALWVSKWPDSQLAWSQRRLALLYTHNRSPQLWKDVDSHLIRLNPPHTFASLAASDWVALGLNLPEARDLVIAEIQWLESNPPPPEPRPTLASLTAARRFTAGFFVPLSTLAEAQIRLRDFPAARAAITRLHVWLDTDFARAYDQDPLETFPDYQSTYYRLSAELAQAEGRIADALAYYQQFITSPYFRRQYVAPVNAARSLWNQIGGTEDAWNVFSAIRPLPPGVPAGLSEYLLPLWMKLDYKLPSMNLPRPGLRPWTNRDFNAKTTFVYVWASWCVPCRPSLPYIQSLSESLRNHPGAQLITLSVDEVPSKLAAFMARNRYTFPVALAKPYLDTSLPTATLGQAWIVDNTGAIRLLHTAFNSITPPQALAAEAIYKLTQLSDRSRR